MVKLIAGVAYLLNIPAEKTKEVIMPVMDFFKQRLKNMLLDQGIRYDVVDAVLADDRNDDIADLAARAQALNAFVVTEEAPALIQAATRVANLCKKIEQETAINTNIFQNPAEGELHKAVTAVNNEVLLATVQFNYAEVLQIACKLVEPINKFFEDVMVMDNDEQIKNNRLALLSAVKDVTHAVGDLNLIV